MVPYDTEKPLSFYAQNLLGNRRVLPKDADCGVMHTDTGLVEAKPCLDSYGYLCHYKVKGQWINVDTATKQKVTDGNVAF